VVPSFDWTCSWGVERAGVLGCLLAQALVLPSTYIPMLWCIMLHRHMRGIPMHHPQRRGIFCQLKLGNISLAARVREELPLATVTDEGLYLLNALHPHEGTSQPPATEERPVQITSGDLAKVLDKVPCRSAAGPSGWPYKHFKAAVKASQEAESAEAESARWSRESCHTC
jgi:hypothetical protein